MPLSLTKRSSLSRPMTTAELDGNFTAIETAVNAKLDTTSYTAAQILSKLNTSGAEYRGVSSELDVKYLQGNVPSSTLPTTTDKSSIVLRSTTGDFTARNITAALIGNADTATSATQAGKLTTARTIAGNSFDGTANITITAAQVSALPIAGGTLTGKLTTISTGTTSGLQIPFRTTVPTVFADGDIWATSAGGFLRISGGTKDLAFKDSDITGTSGNVTGIVAIANGGTGKTNQTDARVALLAAKSGANSDITSLTGLTTPLAETLGGTGISDSGTTGNFLVSNGTTWVTKAVIEPAAGNNGKALVSDGTKYAAVDIGIPVPSGAVVSFYRATAPSGWLECNGQAVSRSGYNALWVAMGSPDTGDGNTTFNVPDLRGEFVRGWDHSRGVDVSRILGSSQKGTIQLTDPNYASHNVYSPIGRSNYTGGSVGTVDRQFPIEMGQDYIENGIATYPNVMLTYSPHGGNTPINLGTQGFSYGATRPRNVALMYCIKT